MALQLEDCTFSGPALPEPFVKLALEARLQKKGLLSKTTGADGKKLEADWDAYRNRLRKLGGRGGPQRVFNQTLEPLLDPLGYESVEQQAEVATREGMENGGWLMSSTNGAKLRVFAVDIDADLDAPSRRGHAYRFSPSRTAQRVLLASGERIGLLTDGEELRILLCDPARPDSHIAISLATHGGWRGARRVPDSFRLLLALCRPSGISAVAELTEEARLSQTKVTDELRTQAQVAIVGFIQELLDEPKNARLLAAHTDKQALAADLWREGLIMVYRLLFVFKLEASPDPARAFSFASTSLWRNTYSPNLALGRHARAVIDDGAETGTLLESGLRTLFKMFVEGLESVELRVSPLGGALFGAGSTALVDALHWGERAVAHLLDQLLWTTGGSKKSDRSGRQRVHYGSLDVEDLGRVYEALLELEPGIATEDMCRLRRDKLEVVVPAAQGIAHQQRRDSKVEFAGDIPNGTFHLRVGLGRKSTGSYYTPHPFVRFLVHETLAAQVAERSPTTDPMPVRILGLNVLDPAMGSGHFLVEACRFLGDQLYEACRLCDELASKEDDRAKRTKDEGTRTIALGRAAELRKRIEDLPDPNDELLAYMPSRVSDADAGLSQVKAMALCRRLIAVHSLYGVDKNPLAVELAKLSLWLESYAEGLPLTFLDHRLVCGDSLTGGFLANLATYPGAGEPFDQLLARDVDVALHTRVESALTEIKHLEASIGKDIADIEHKRVARERFDAVLAPLKRLAAAWAGGVMLGLEGDADGRCDDGAYVEFARAIAAGGTGDDVLARSRHLRRMIELGNDGIAYDLCFPEVFLSPTHEGHRGFDAVVGNPPWDKPHAELQHFLSSTDLSILELRNSVEIGKAAERLFEKDASLRESWHALSRSAKQLRDVVIRIVRQCEADTKTNIGASHVDVYMGFAVRAHLLLSPKGAAGMLLSGGFAKNPAALPIRALWIRDSEARRLALFHNTNRLFADLPTILEFSLVVARKAKGGVSNKNVVGLDLVGFEQLDDDSCWQPLFPNPQSLLLTFSDLVNGGGRPKSHTNRDNPGPLWDMVVSMTSHLLQEVYPSRAPLKLVSEMIRRGVTEDVRTREQALQFLGKGVAVLLEGRSIYQFEGIRLSDHVRWNPVPTQLVELDGIQDALGRLRFFRLALRRKVGSPKSNARSVVAAVIPPGLACSDSLMVEQAPHARPNWKALAVASILNSFAVDAAARPRIQVMIGQKQLQDLAAPMLDRIGEADGLWRFLAHSSLRLHAESLDYRELWTEQLGGNWREATVTKRWPVLREGERSTVRAAVDAVLARAYGHSHAEYDRLLKAFSHKAAPETPVRCLRAFDEFEKIGFDKFCRKHDPYWDVALVDRAPAPVIELPKRYAMAGVRSQTRGANIDSALTIEE
jgi:hypothetical protein